MMKVERHDENLVDEHRGLAATAPLLWTFCGFALGIFLGEVFGVWASVVCTLAGSALAACLRSRLPWRVAVATLLAVAMGGVRWLLFNMGCGQSYLRRLPRAECAVEMRLTVKDVPISSPSLASLVTGRPKLTGEILAMRTRTDEALEPATGNVRLAFPTALQERMEALREDDIIEASGELLVPEAPTGGGFSNYRHLRSLGVHRILVVRDFTVAGQGTGWAAKTRRGLRRLRILLVERLVHGLASVENARMAATLAMGQRHFMDGEAKELFSQAGAIHIFAISGLHIGVAALLVMGCLRKAGCPPRPAWLLTSAATCIYVTLAGFSPSAMRALAMTLLMFYAWLRWRPVSVMNALGASGFLALAANPGALFNLGFLYSYLVVFALVFTWPAINGILQVAEERSLWIPRRLLHGKWTRKAMHAAAAALMTSAMAWMASLGISLYNGTRVCLLSPLLNLILGACVPAALALCLLKMAAAFICTGLDAAAAKILDLLLAFMKMLAEWTASSPLCLSNRAATWFECLAYYSAWFLFVCEFHGIFTIKFKKNA